MSHTGSMFTQYKRSFILATITLTTAFTRPVYASPLFDLVGDTSSTAALQARTTPGGSASAYFNPALLIDAPTGVSIGFSLLNERIGVRLAGRSGTQFAIPEGLTNAAHADGMRFDNYAIPTNLLQFGRAKDMLREAFTARPRQGAGSGHDLKTYEVLGIVLKLFDDRVALGLHAMIPNGKFTQMRVFFNDEREQYFSNSLHPELYGDRMTALSLATGLGIAVTRDLSLGIGTTFALQADAVAPTYVVDTGNLSKVLVDLNAGVSMGFAPHFGASYKLGSRVRFTATVHTPQKLELNTSFTFLLPTALEQSSSLRFVLNYTPWKIGAGASVDVVQSAAQTLSLAGSVLYAGWSAYEDRHGVRPSPAYGWSDTVNVTLGARYRLRELGAALDLSYVPTPVPEQTGRSNYVDNDRIAGSAGADYGFQLGNTHVRVGAQLQVHHLLTRHHVKLETPTRADGAEVAPERVKDELPDDAHLSGEPVAAAAGLQTNNPGWPGFSSGGWILGGTVYVTVTL